MVEFGETPDGLDVDTTAAKIADLKLDDLRRENPIILGTITHTLEKFGIVGSTTADMDEELRIAREVDGPKPDDLFVFKPEFEAGIAVDEISRLLGTSILLGQKPEEVVVIASENLEKLDSIIDYLKSSSGRLPVMYAYDLEGEEIMRHIEQGFIFVDKESAEMIASHHPNPEIRKTIQDRVLSDNSNIKLDGLFSFSINEPIVVEHREAFPDKQGVWSTNPTKNIILDEALKKS